MAVRAEIRKAFEADNFDDGMRIGREVIERFKDRFPSAMECLAEDLEACLRGYEYAMLLILHRMVTAEALDLGEQRGAALLDVSLRRLEARLRAIEPERLLLSGAGV